jgi:hypothetical protein
VCQNKLDNGLILPQMHGKILYKDSVMFSCKYLNVKFFISGTFETSESPCVVCFCLEFTYFDPKRNEVDNLGYNIKRNFMIFMFPGIIKAIKSRN